MAVPAAVAPSLASPGGHARRSSIPRCRHLEAGSSRVSRDRGDPRPLTHGDGRLRLRGAMAVLTTEPIPRPSRSTIPRLRRRRSVWGTTLISAVQPHVLTGARLAGVRAAVGTAASSESLSSNRTRAPLIPRMCQASPTWHSMPTRVPASTRQAGSPCAVRGTRVGSPNCMAIAADTAAASKSAPSHRLYAWYSTPASYGSGCSDITSGGNRYRWAGKGWAPVTGSGRSQMAASIAGE